MPHPKDVGVHPLSVTLHSGFLSECSGCEDREINEDT